MALAMYTGSQVLTFMDYLDAETGRTLVGEPGVTYDVLVAATGRPVPELPPGFTAVTPAEPESPTDEAAEEPAPEVPE